MARLSGDIYKKLRKKYDVDTIWSFSRINTYLDQPWCYRMQYIEKADVNGDNIYSYFGTICHDIIESYYEGHHQAHELLGIFNTKVSEWEKLDNPNLKFPSEKVRDGYILNIQHYFENFEPIEHPVTSEQPVLIVLNRNDRNYVLVGYIDSTYWTDDKTKLHIVDYKTSSKSGFSGKKLKEKARQLLLYAIGAHQKTGVAYENISVEYDMLKYVNVRYLQKNGKWATSLQERSNWVSSQQNKLLKLLMDNDIMEFEAQEMIDNAILDNSLESMPDYVQERFKIEKGVVVVEATEKDMNELSEFIMDVIDEIEHKSKGDLEVEFPEPVIDESNSFFFHVLGKPFLQYHQGYKDMMLMNGMNTDGADLDDIMNYFE